MKLLDTDIAFLGLSQETQLFWQRFIVMLRTDGCEHSYDDLVRFLIEARREGTEVDFSHIEIAMAEFGWTSEAISGVTDAVDAIQGAIDLLTEEYRLELDPK